MNEGDFLAFAATILKVDPAKLSRAVAYGSLPEWDSVNHLRLVMETEKHFDVYYPIEIIPSLHCLDDFLRLAQPPLKH